MHQRIDRRQFLKNSGTVLAASQLGTVALAQKTVQSPAPAVRLILPINRGWRYTPKTTEAARAPDFDDSTFDRVVLPHTNVKLPWHSFPDTAYEFVSLYRRPLNLPAEATAPGRRVFLDFEGVMTATTVFLNGQNIGSYKGGFTPFSFELTGHLDPAGKNLLAVEVDSTERADMPPFGYEIDYLTFGGIYREVALRSVPEVFLGNIHARPIEVLTNPGLEVDVFLDVPATAGKAKRPKLELRAELFRSNPTTNFSGAPRPPVGPVPDQALHEQAAGAGTKVDHFSSPPLATITQKLPNPTPTPTLNNADAGQAQGWLAPTDPNALPTKPHLTLRLPDLKNIELWDLDHPHLYTVRVQLLENGRVLDEMTRRIGFREAKFTDGGFSLNGKIVKLHGLDRHQTFPYVGQAMPARPQRQDAKILRHDLRCNLVRTSHYPQSRHFLDACDELGLLVLEEIPGWQHIGPLPWQDIAVDNVRRMVTRDWNHPSIILWGVRINESRDNHDLYTRTNALAHALDRDHQTCGIRYFQGSESLEDVFTMNDFGWPLKAPNHPKYLNTEFVGHTFPTKTIDSKERLEEHTHRHARVHDQLASNPQFSGGIGWCAFDYNTHSNFGSGDRICYHGVTDIFRTPKPAAGFYKSMCDPAEEIVLEPAFHWARNDESTGFTDAYISSNVDHIKISINPIMGPNVGKGFILLAEGDPDRKTYPNLPHPPFKMEIGDKIRDNWGDLRIEGFIAGKQVISKDYSGKGIDQQFRLLPDETNLVADGADTVRVILRVNDEFGQIRPFAADAIEMHVEGPAEIIGDTPFSLIGGTGAIWLRTKEEAGTVRLTAKHPTLGKQTATFTLAAAEPETA